MLLLRGDVLLYEVMCFCMRGVVLLLRGDVLVLRGDVFLYERCCASVER